MTVSTRDISFERADGDTLVAHLSGPWTLDDGVPTSAPVRDACEANAPVRRLVLDVEQVSKWDSALIAFLRTVHIDLVASAIPLDTATLPSGIRQLLELSTAVEEREGAARSAERTPLVARIGTSAVDAWEQVADFFSFVGEATLAFGGLFRGKARFRRGDLALFIQEAGADALPIVTLINFLVGVILAFIGAVQLQQFGATIYIANLVSIAMVREMAAMMTGIAIAGRTGAAYAAQLGTMTVNEEVDALRTMGMNPMEFLVLPRMLALMLMLPLLTLYADFVGMLGGAFVGTSMFEISITQFFEQTRESLSVRHFALGLFKGSVYGVLVALAGCYRGMRSGRSAAAVGQATTSAVVMSLVLIISASAVLTVLFTILGL
jgi:phospholipid/cholesterol/gamma-HCH transport system permease protein